MTNPVNAKLDRYAVVGHPVEHSQSPFIHAQFGQQTGRPIDYGRLLSPLDGFEATVRRFADEGAKGCNVTVPFKFEACRLAGQRSARAELAGAANLMRFDVAGWWADNTDGIGLVRDIEMHAGQAIAGCRVLMLGAGGAAAGALGPLLQARPAELVLANRTLGKAEALVERHAPLAAAEGVALRPAELADCGTAYHIVINATATSLSGAGIPVPPDVLAPDALALDMMYGAGAKGFLDWAAAHGARGRDGLGMLVEQAAEAFDLWQGVRPDTVPVLAALRARLAIKTT